MTTRLLEGRPLLTAVVFVAIGVLPLYLTSAQVVLLTGELGFDPGRLGIATAIYFGGAALAAQPVASVVASIGARRGLQCGCVLSGLGSLAGATAHFWWSLLFAVALAGLANAFMQVSTNVLLATGADFRRQGMSFGAKQGAIPLASALAGALLPSVGVVVGWRWPFVAAAAAAVLTMTLAPPIDDVRTVTRATPRRADRPPLSRALKFMAVGGAFGGAAGNGISLFVAPAAVDIGTSEAGAGTLLAVGSVLVFLLRVGVGAFADRVKSTGQREMSVILGVGALACFGLAMVSSRVGFLVVMPLALMGAWGWPGLVYFSVVRLHPEATARASGVILASNLTGTLVGPSVVGQLADQGAYPTAWIFVGTLAALSSICMAASARVVRMPDRAGGQPQHNI